MRIRSINVSKVYYPKSTGMGVFMTFLKKVLRFGRGGFFQPLEQILESPAGVKPAQFLRVTLPVRQILPWQFTPHSVSESDQLLVAPNRLLRRLQTGPQPLGPDFRQTLIQYINRTKLSQQIRRNLQRQSPARRECCPTRPQPGSTSPQFAPAPRPSSAGLAPHPTGFPSCRAARAV